MVDDISFGVHVDLATPDDFLKCKETLSRIGVASHKDKKLYQSCHILHKKGRYYIVHFKELFKLDGKPTTISDEDIQRRNLVSSLLHDWGLLKIVDEESSHPRAQMSTVKVLSFSEKNSWKLETKYNIGVKR